MSKAFVTDGDLGSGEPGSLSWHKCNIRQLNDEEKVAYIREIFPNIKDDFKLAIMLFLITDKLNNENDFD